MSTRPPIGRRVADFVVRIARGMWTQGALDSAASMAFNFFLSLIPLLVLVGRTLRVVIAVGLSELVGAAVPYGPACEGGGNGREAKLEVSVVRNEGIERPVELDDGGGP